MTVTKETTVTLGIVVLLASSVFLAGRWVERVTFEGNATREAMKASEERMVALVSSEVDKIGEQLKAMKGLIEARIADRFYRGEFRVWLTLFRDRNPDMAVPTLDDVDRFGVRPQP